MIEVDVKLRYTDHARHSACAVLLAGDDAQLWVRWLDAADVPLEDVRLLPLSDPEQGHRVIGAICPLPQHLINSLEGQFPHYGTIAGRLFVPIESSFDPPLTDSDWNDLLPSDRSLFVWHPQLGLIRFETEQQLAAADLFCSPASGSTDWSCADPGTALRARLHSLQAEELPSFEQVMRQGQADIGSKEDQRSQLPRSEREPPKYTLGEMLFAPLRPFASLAHWFMKQIPERPGGSELLLRFELWLERLTQMTPQILREREREIHRLLEKLKRDPDEGLKYALPMSGLPGRGVAPPGSRLTKRDVDFRLGPGGSGPVDTWMLDYDLQQQLLAQYRDSAEREVRLGRFRRAAYIHAELLGDFPAAAAVLERGKHYHEAAALFRDKLSRPDDAARCLERGGLLHDAIEVYRDLNQHVKVGELYLQLDQTEDAQAAFQLAVTERLEHDDRLGAATLLEKRLADTDSALRVLEQGWPDSPQAVNCLERYFALTGQLGEHERAQGKIDDLRHDVLQAGRQDDLIAALAHLATEYPDANLRNHAADSTRLLASRRLEQSYSVPRVVMQSLSRLAPEDRLLERDCRRFKRHASQAITSRATPRRAGDISARANAVQTKSIPLPSGYYWLCAESIGDHFYLVGHDDQERVILIRRNWNGDRQSNAFATWNGRGCLIRDIPTVLGIGTEIRIARLGAQPLPPRTLPPTDDFQRRISVETPGWAGEDLLGLGCVGIHSWAVSKDLLVTQYSREGVPLTSVQLDVDELSAVSGLDATTGLAAFSTSLEDEEQSILMPGFDPPIPIHVRHESVSIGLGQTFFRVNGADRACQSLMLPSRITGLTGSRPHTRERILITHELGAFLLFPTFSSLAEVMIEEQMPDLHGCFLRDGRAILWNPAPDGQGELRQYSTSKQEVVFLGATPMASPPFEADAHPFLLPTNRPSECAVIPTQLGASASIWSFPRLRNG